jgi:tetratricopeptide (TPR) repeat protein
MTDDTRKINGSDVADQPLVLEDEEGLFSNEAAEDTEKEIPRDELPPTPNLTEDLKTNDPQDRTSSRISDLLRPSDSYSDELDPDREFYAQFEKDKKRKPEVEAEEIDESLLTPIEEGAESEKAIDRESEYPVLSISEGDESTSTLDGISLLPPPSTEPVSVPITRKQRNKRRKSRRPKPLPEEQRAPVTTSTEATSTEATSIEATSTEATSIEAESTVSETPALNAVDEVKPRLHLKLEPREAIPGDGVAVDSCIIQQRAVAHRVYPLANSAVQGIGGRGAFLVDLAEHMNGAQKARLLVAAADIEQQGSEPKKATALYERALEVDRKNVVALVAIRRDACASGDWAKAAELLRTESELSLTAQERAMILTLLAEVLLRKLDDNKGAQQAAEAALAAYPAAIPAGLLLAEIHLSCGREFEGIDALQKTADAWEDKQSREALLVEGARLLERTTDIGRAAQFLQRVLELNPQSLPAMADVVRTSRTIGDIDTSINTLLKMSEQFETGSVRDAIRRIAARYALYLKKNPKQALELLSGDTSAWGVRTRRLAAAKSNDDTAYRSAVEAWTQISHGCERAIAFVELARLYLSQGNTDQAREALQQASLADNRIGAIRVLREAIARQNGDVSDLISSVESEDTSNALTVAAKLARFSDRADNERKLLDRAARQSEGALTAEIIALDAAAKADDHPSVRSALLKQVEQAKKEERIGPLFAAIYLSLREQAERNEQAAQGDEESKASLPQEIALNTDGSIDAISDAETRPTVETDDGTSEGQLEASDNESAAVEELSADDIEERTKTIRPPVEPSDKREGALGEELIGLLEETHAAIPDSPLVLRQLIRVTTDREKTAGYLLKEYESTDGTRSAYAATEAGRYLERAHRDPMNAYRQALNCVPGYAPACWAIEIRAHALVDIDALVLVHEQLAEYADSPQERASRLVRAALIRTAENRTMAITLLRRALAIRPQDSVTNELLIRLLDKNSSVEIGEKLLANAQGDSPEIVRAARLKAAAVFENGRQIEKAADLYQQVIEASEKPEPLALFALERLEIALGRHDRIRKRLLDNLKNAQDNSGRTASLHRLIEFECDHGDESNALTYLNSLLEIEPGHIPTLRLLERYFIEQNNSEEIYRITDALTKHLTDPSDIASYLRELVRLKLLQKDAPPESADEIILQNADRGVADLWLAQKLESAARAANDKERVAQALSASVVHYVDPMERASIALRAAEEANGGVLDDVIEKLNQAVLEAPEHPIAAEELGSLYEKSGKPPKAAHAYELAAGYAQATERKARLWRQAAVLWQDQINDADRALAALIQARDADITYSDVFSRLKGQYKQREDTKELAELLRMRIEKGGDVATNIDLNVELSSLYAQLGDRGRAKECLRTALDMDPHHDKTLRALADMHLEDKEWSEATDLLILLARLTKDNAELCWLFYKLGDIYDKYLPDLERAEIAFTKVVTLQPEGVDAIERLIDLYQRQGMHDKAARALQRLVELAEDDESAIKNEIRFAFELEQLGQQREAEQLLESCRKQSPTNILVINALTEFYRRQFAHPALSMHLNRASTELRNALIEDPTNVENWRGLVEVLLAREQTPSAHSCASTASAVGVLDEKLSAFLVAGSAPSFIKAINNPEIDHLIAPSWFTESVRFVFGATAFPLDKALPFNAKSYGAERLRKKSPDLERMLSNVCQWFGRSEVHLLTSSKRICMPVSNDPLTIIVGESLLEQANDAEKQFLFTRAMKLATNNLSVLVRTPVEDLSFAIHALIRHFDHSHDPGVDLAKLDETAHQLARGIPRKYHEELGHNVFEMKGIPAFNPLSLPAIANEFGSRAALVATGATPAAITALLKIDNISYQIDSPKTMVETINTCPAARSLLSFALSDAFLSAREMASKLDSK